MILGEIRRGTSYRHMQTGKIVDVQETSLLIKTDRYWYTAVSYIVSDDKSGQTFAVPVDDFRVRFEQIPPKEPKED